MPKRKRRSLNLSPSEISSLIHFAIKYKSVIENKEMSPVVWREKDETWNKLTDEFNSLGGYVRNHKTLRNKYDSLKHRLKIKMAQNKKAFYYTGKEETPLSEWERALLSIMSVNVEESTSINYNESIKEYEDFSNLDDETSSVEFDTSSKTITEKPGYSRSLSVEGSISTNDCDSIKVEPEDDDFLNLNDNETDPVEFDTIINTITEKPGCSQSSDINNTLQDNEQSCEGRLSNNLKQFTHEPTKLTAESLNKNDVLTDSKKELLDLQIEVAKTELELKRKQISYLKEEHQMKREIHLLSIQKLKKFK